MALRDFSDTIKFEVVKNNLEKNNGNIQCETCGKKLVSISECHFDHIFPFAKGGKSILSNCQILCSDCNLKKNDKLIDDFMLEEKARRFLAGARVAAEDLPQMEDEKQNNEKATDKKTLTKEEFDAFVGIFIERKGDIKKVDFTREYNNLPSIHYVKLFYGGLNALKKAFGIVDMSLNWDRESISKALVDYVEVHGDLLQEDLKKSNNLPSLPCILKYYPEYANFSEMKEGILNLQCRTQWDREKAISAGKEFVRKNGKITEKDLKAKNGLPTTKVIYRLFGTINDYQKEVGSELTQKNDLISKDDIREELDLFFEGKERVIESKNDFFKEFSFSQSTIYKRYGDFTTFCAEENITVLNSKKARYTKREVDDAISAWVREGNPIPKSHELTKNGLPSMAVIMKYYENWKEPFILYAKIHEEANRNTSK